MLKSLSSGSNSGKKMMKERLWGQACNIAIIEFLASIAFIGFIAFLTFIALLRHKKNIRFPLHPLNSLSKFLIPPQRRRAGGQVLEFDNIV